MNNAKILVIDDDDMLRLLVHESLKPFGYQVIECDNGLDGIEIFGSTHPDLVLLDVLMPGMDGFECLQQLRQDDTKQQLIPIVMLTAVEDSASVQKAFSLGATDFIPKPIHWPLLPYKIDYILRNSNITQKLAISQAALAEDEERLRLSLHAAKQGLYDLNIASGNTVVSDGYASMLGYAPDAFHETSEAWLARLHPDDKEPVTNTFKQYIAGKIPEYRAEFRQRCADASWKWILSTGKIMEWDADGKPTRMLGTHTDIDAMKQAQEQLALYANVFEKSGEGVFICGPDERILSVNASFVRITGYQLEEVLQQHISMLNSGKHDDAFYKNIWDTVSKKDYWQGELWNRRHNGEPYAEWLGVSAVRDPYGKITHYIGVFSDITDRKVIEEKIEYLAHHDSLTGLPNRSLLEDRFNQAVAFATRQNRMIAMLFLDLDHFKQVNDSLGHDIGDQLLIEIAGRIKGCVREVDTVCRQGGDEFIILLNNIASDDNVTQIINKIFEELRKPFLISDHKLSASFSAGISLYPSDGETFQALQKKADTAMYSAKENGRNSYRFFSPGMNALSLERMEIENGLRHALEAGEFRLYYQPQYCLSTKKILGVEALIRWQKPDGEILMPEKFIRIAEDSGLIIPIGNWVLNEACRQGRIWQDENIHLTVGVNISGLQFRKGDLVETVQNTLKQHALDPSYLELELTESILIQDTEKVLDTIKALKAIGVKFSIDDFGTGYSSLYYLKRFAVDRVKIDQSFINDLMNSQEDVAIVRAILQLGESLKINTIAEGVETLDQLECLAQLGCDNAQGFYLNHPMQADDITAKFIDE